MEKIHLEAFKIAIKIPNKYNYRGRNCYNWANSVLRDCKSGDKIFEDKIFEREELFEYCKDKNISNLNLVVAIFSWGGMRCDHAKNLFKSKGIQEFSDLVSKLRNGEFNNRIHAFEEFKKLIDEGLVVGLGIGYFTKLICFLDPCLKGYIMDQWVSKSINLLNGQKIVKISSNNWVNNHNDSNSYELFCSKIDELGELIGCNGFEAEEKLFSNGGKDKFKGKWRKYVISNYS
jgi:hypothetical protein